MIEKNIDTYETEREIDWTTKNDYLEYTAQKRMRGAPERRKTYKYSKTWTKRKRKKEEQGERKENKTEAKIKINKGMKRIRK